MLDRVLNTPLITHFQIKIFHDGGLYHIKTIPLICIANQWTGFYMIGSSVMKELMTDNEHKTLFCKSFNS